MATTITSGYTSQNTDLMATAAGTAEPLSQREVVLVQTLLANQGRVVARTELARAVGLRQQARRVDVHLVNVRRALDDSLINVRGRGWMVPRGYAVTEACQSELDAYSALAALDVLGAPTLDVAVTSQAMSA